MKNILKIITIILSFILLLSCAEKTFYSGKIIKTNNNINNFKSKEELIKNLGYPSYIDPIEKKFFYFSEKIVTKNFFDTKIVDRKLIVFHFDSENLIQDVNEYNLNNQNEIKLVKKETTSEIIKQGLLEKIFGGVGTDPLAP